ncbi:MAG: isoprenylcysteine carboxylmethyltransferase family protein [Candidatus Heimdallarchaeota archaeon]|nr:isoprenylcysteine carboxylmethyltransferase family protein [Candidatus Heimdallarchaeota archaeon]
MKLRDYILVTITWVSLFTQIILTFVLWDNYYDIYALVIVGYVFWGLSIIFGVIPIFSFRKRGGVPKKSSYIHTTELVDSGIYAIVRHPQFFAGILWSMAIVFISQHWVVDVLLIPVVVTTYLDTLRANKDLIEKFGEDYVKYMKTVPGLNAFWGIMLLVFRKIKRDKK